MRVRTIVICVAAAVLAAALLLRFHKLGGPYFEMPETVQDHVAPVRYPSADAIVLARRAAAIVPRGTTVTFLQPSQAPNYDVTHYLTGAGLMPHHRVLAPAERADYVIAIREPFEDAAYQLSIEWPEGRLYIRQGAQGVTEVQPAQTRERISSIILGVIAYLLLPLFGLFIWRLDVVKQMDVAAKLAIAFAAGMLVVALVLTAMSLVGIAWSRTSVIVALAIVAAVSVRDVKMRGASVDRRALLAIGFFALLTTYGLVTARESCGDLHFFWGPKAVHFVRAGGIDVAFLADKNYYPMHPDYPPLLPLLYSWSHLVAKHFSFVAAIVATALFLFGSVFMIRGASRDDLGAVLIAATLSYTFAVAFAGGGADPPLVFFEALTLSALTFVDDERSANILTALGLAGAMWSKIEGATFVIAVVLAIVVVQRRVRRALIVTAPAALLLVAWLVFVKTNGILDMYRGAGMKIYFEILPKTLGLTAKLGSYELWGLPWLVPIVLIAIGRTRRAAALPLAVAVLTLGATIFFYIHVPDPTWWIHASAQRVLLTPLVALLIGAVAASRPHGQVYVDQPVPVHS